MKKDFEYGKGIRKDMMPDVVATLAESFERAYPAGQGFTVTTKHDHSKDSARWLVYVHQGMTTGFSVLLSAPLAKPASATLKVGWSSRILRVVAWAAFAVGVVIAIISAAALASDHSSGGKPSYLAALVTGVLAAVAVYGVGWVVARAIGSAAGNPFSGQKLGEIGEQASAALVQDGARPR